MEKMAVLAPMPTASVRTATAVKPGLLASWRSAKRRSFIGSRGSGIGCQGRTEESAAQSKAAERSDPRSPTPDRYARDLFPKGHCTSEPGSAPPGKPCGQHARQAEPADGEHERRRIQWRQTVQQRGRIP